MGKEPDHTYSDEELINGIIKGDYGIFRYVGEQAIPYVMKSLGKEGSKQLAKEIVHDASIVVYRKAVAGGLNLNCKFITYFLAVCKKIWSYQNRIKGKKLLWNGDIHESPLVDEEEIGSLWKDSREFRLYRRHFDELKERQRAMFESSLEGVPYKELYGRFGFKTEEAFKNEVYRIRRKLFQKITEDPEFRILFNRTHWSYNE